MHKYLFFVFILAGTFYSEKTFADKTVLLTSTPDHAAICEKKRRDLICNKTTPFKYPVDTAAGNKLVIKKSRFSIRSHIH